MDLTWKEEESYFFFFFFFRVIVFTQCWCFLVFIPKVESSDWLEAHPGPAPIKRCGDGSLPFAALDLELVGRGRGEEFHLGGSEEGGPGSFQRCLIDEKQIRLLACICTLLIQWNITSSQLCARWRGPAWWWGSGRTQFIVGEEMVQLERA